MQIVTKAKTDPKEGDTRFFSRFLWLPMWAYNDAGDTVLKWLEHASWTEVYWVNWTYDIYGGPERICQWDKFWGDKRKEMQRWRES